MTMTELYRDEVQ